MPGSLHLPGIFIVISTTLEARAEESQRSCEKTEMLPEMLYASYSSSLTTIQNDTPREDSLLTLNS
ncbi:hypothetical protein BD749_2308 [Pontibacter ramchanderi]|uniref:Uncharacterized protein n=1 Tax=Pontibacter ramchanderi TaxID=1179743 RepID=A0A2N3UCS2_9BACT|nr:hypothetical protein BD749_2308 [Pontibacter ramchanderi]